jgi:hypothetical protein
VQATVGFQMLGTSKRTGMGDFHKAIENGLGGGASYLEIYEFDVVNPQFSEDIQFAATQLQTLPDQRTPNFSLETFPSSDLAQDKFQKTHLRESKKGIDHSSIDSGSHKQLAQQLHRARKSFLKRDFQKATELLQGAKVTLDLLQKEYPQVESQLLEAETKLDQTIHSLNRGDFRETQRLYEETLQILKAAKMEVLSP